jgi:hypothetical protein
MELQEGMQLEHSNICVWYQIKIKMVTSASFLQPKSGNTTVGVFDSASWRK